MESGSVIGVAYMKTNMRVVTCVAEKRSGVDSVSSDQAATAFVSLEVHATASRRPHPQFLGSARG